MRAVILILLILAYIAIKEVRDYDFDSTEWFLCKKCCRLSNVEILTVNRCPFCGHDYLSKVILEGRDVSPTYTYHAKPNDLPMKTEWMPLPEAPKEAMT